MTLSTGIEALDRKLSGGLAPGTLVAVLTPPGVQHDPLLCAGADERASHFYTTVKGEATVRRSFDRSAGGSKIEDIEQINPAEADRQFAARIHDIEDDEDFYVDVIDPIEESLDRDRYGELLNSFDDKLAEIGSVGYLYGLVTKTPPHNRRYTLDFADCVLRLRARQQRGKLNYYLEIPKATGVSLSGTDRYLEIDIDRGVDIDQTRNI
jgi:KaiC/GvpD/RAD55 family RecA-like ATPase